MNAIEFDNVTYKYGSAAPALREVSFSVEAGSFVALVGHNGSGKSTLAKLINGLLRPKEGRVLVFSRDTSDDKLLFDIRKDVGLVFQNPDNQMVASIVEDDIAFGPENIGVPREEIGVRITEALRAVGMEEFRLSTPTHLSGGQKQRIAIAGALAIKPKILIFDESTAMLDPMGRAEVLNIAHRLNKEEGMTVILVTHYMEEVTDADRVVVLGGGELILSGTPKEVFDRNDILDRAGLSVPLATSLARELGIKDEVLKKEELLERLCESLVKT